MTEQTIKPLSNLEANFIKWWGDRKFEDFYETNGLVHLHHYIFKLKDYYHISFSDKNTIICATFKSMAKVREKKIYNGLSLANCVYVIEKREAIPH